MPYAEPEFAVPMIPEDERFGGTEIDENLRDGNSIATDNHRRAC